MNPFEVSNTSYSLRLFLKEKIKSSLSFKPRVNKTCINSATNYQYKLTLFPFLGFNKNRESFRIGQLNSKQAGDLQIAKEASHDKYHYSIKIKDKKHTKSIH